MAYEQGWTHKGKRPEDITNKMDYSDYVEDSSHTINREFDRITSQATTSPDPVVQWMQLRVLDNEARRLNLQFDGYFDMPLIDSDEGRQRMIDALIALADAAYSEGKVTLGGEISAEANLRYALFDVDKEIQSPTIIASHRRDREKAKDHRETYAKLLDGPCDTTIRSWNPPGPLMSIPLSHGVPRGEKKPKGTAVYRRTNETTSDGHLIYRYDHTKFD